MDIPTTLIGLKWSELRRRAQAFVDEGHPNSFELMSSQYYRHPAWEVRSFALGVLGKLAASDTRVLDFLYEECGTDPAWQVNEVLAMAFDDYCAAVGYEQALPQLDKWLAAPQPNLRRAVSEGLRPWTANKRAYFAKNPQVAVALLGRLKDDDSRYVQESVGNALRDISRKHFELVLNNLHDWLGQAPQSKSRQVIAKFAMEQAVKNDPTFARLWQS
jgi:3-methyladenine DNA glycosylase AlkC